MVTALLAWARRTGRIDGAVVSVADPSKPAAPVPRAVTTEEEILGSGTSWYTYCPNNLALEEAEKKGLTKVAFVGVPCQITPVRKMELRDPSYLDNGRKKEKHIERQTKFLKGFAARVALNIGLLCSEVFTFDGLMVDTIEKQMGIPLDQIAKFNVKGKVLIYKKDGELVEMSLREAQEYARPECHHCADFSGELADISCGGVGVDGLDDHGFALARGEQIFDAAMRDGLFEVRPIEEFENSMKVLLRLARKQRERVPVPPGRRPGFVRPPGFATHCRVAAFALGNGCCEASDRWPGQVSQRVPRTLDRELAGHRRRRRSQRRRLLLQRRRGEEPRLHRRRDPRAERRCASTRRIEEARRVMAAMRSDGVGRAGQGQELRDHLRRSLGASICRSPSPGPSSTTTAVWRSAPSALPRTSARSAARDRLATLGEVAVGLCHEINYPARGHPEPDRAAQPLRA